MSKHLLGTLFFWVLFSPSFLFSQGNALDFDGTDDYVSVLDATDPTGYTIEMWVKFNSTGKQTVLGRTSSGGLSSGLGTGILLNDGAKILHYNYDGLTLTQTGTTTIVAAQWYHIAVTASNSGTMRLYVNGVEEGSATSVGTMWTGGDRWHIGQNNPGGGHGFFDGEIDELRIWTTERSAATIQSSMRQTLSGRETGLRMYYTFNQSSGTSVTDQTTNALNGTFTSSPAWIASGVPFYPDKGNALTFDGSDENITTSTNTVLQNNSFTVEFWAKRNSIDAEVIAFSQGTGSTRLGLQVGWKSDNSAFFGFWNDDLEVSGQADLMWHHWAFAYDASGNTQRIYKDGVQIGSRTTSGDFAGSGAFVIGRKFDFAEYINGLIDELRVWGNERTSKQILDNMNSTLTGTESNLLAYYDFNGSTGSKLIDLSLNERHGTLLNMEDGDWTASNAWLNSFVATTTGFRMLASPVATTYADVLAEGWTQGATGSDAPSSGTSNVWTWNNSSTGSANTNWTAVSDLTTTVNAGQGFLYYHFNNDDYAGGTNTVRTTFSVSGTENANPSITVNTNTDGWTLVGNPFASTINWGSFGTKTNLYSDARVWNPGTSSWVLTSSEAKIAPFQSFFVQTFSSSPVLSIGAGAKTSGSVFLGKTNEISELALVAKSGTFEDEAMLRFHAAGDLGRDAFDAEKSAPLSSPYLAIPLQWNGKTYAINSLPLITEAVEVPMAVEFTLSGNVAVSIRKNTLPEGWSVGLKDNKTGVTHPVDDGFSYAFDHSAATKTAPEGMQSPKMQPMQAAAEPRFTLIVTPANTTSAEQDLHPTRLALYQNFPNPFNPSTTIQWSVAMSGFVKLALYDLNGRQIHLLYKGNATAGKHATYLNAVSLASGIYLIRMETAGQVFTKKITLLK